MNEAKLVDDIRAALKSGTAEAEVPRLGTCPCPPADAASLASASVFDLPASSSDV